MKDFNDILLDLIDELIEELDQATDKKQTTEFDDGRVLGLAEALSAIQQHFIVEEKVEQKLNFDIDARYLLTSQWGHGKSSKTRS